MVLVPVREDKRSYLFAILEQVADVWNDDVHTEQFGFGEHQPAINDDDVIAPADGHAIHAELAESAERYDVKLAFRHNDSA
jgi:hypothetical protein